MSSPTRNLFCNIILYLPGTLLPMYNALSAMLTRSKLLVKLAVQILSDAAWNLTHHYRLMLCNTLRLSGTLCRSPLP
jgi:hypothetical protein